MAVYRSSHTERDDGTGPVPAEPVPGVTAAEETSEATRTTRQSAIMAAGSLVSRVIGFVRNALIGMALGSAVGDVYTSALFLPNQIYELLLGGILSSILIPLLVRRRKTDPDGGEAYTQKLLTFSVVALGIATALVVAAAAWITIIQAASNTPPEYRDLLTDFAYWLLPIIFFTGLSAIFGSVLNVRGHFAAPMWTPILNNFVVIAACGTFLLAFDFSGGLTIAKMSLPMIAVIGGGTLLGVIVQMIGLLPALRSVGFRWRWNWDPRGLGLGEIGRLSGWMLVYVAANQAGISISLRLLSVVSGKDQASTLAFNNVFLLSMMAHGIIGVSVMTALLPKMSEAAAEGRFADVSADLRRGINLTVTALMPIVVVYAVLGTPIAVTLFQGGNLTPQQAWATGDVLLAGAAMVIPLSVSYLCTFSFFALQGTKAVALINLPVVVVRVALYVLFSAVLGTSLVAAGMTAANAISYALSAIVSLVVLRRWIGRLNLNALIASLLKVLAAGLVAALLGWLVLKVLPGGSQPGKVDALVQAAVGGVVILIGYLAAALALRIPEISQGFALVRRKLGR